MAIIKCKECGKDISTTADCCPHCGYRTEHGRSVSEAKGYLVWGIIAMVLLFVGFILVFSNLGEFIDRADNLDRYKYFSDEGKSCVKQFFIGLILIISALVDAFVIRYKMNEMRDSGRNGFLSEQTAARHADFYGQSAASTPKSQGQQQNYIPAWKRVQMMEAEKETQEKECKNNVCIFCGAAMSEDQRFCGACGKSRD